MYQGYFGFDGPPFSIVPDHRVVYMSDSHREAVAHLLHSLETSGGFVQLTGEVGTGKTTVSRYLLQHLPKNVDVALLLNPRINELEMLETICDELGVEYGDEPTLKKLIGILNDYLLASHASGRHTVLMIDEAQNLSREVLEQVRLLTNLETTTDKLLQIILIGQPELVSVLGRHDLRQLSQRIIGRFTLKPLNLRETREYIRYRLQQAGCERTLFTAPATRRIHRLAGGVPRLINVLCDSALMGAYSENRDKVNRRIVGKAAGEVLPTSARSRGGRWFRIAVLPVLLLSAVAGTLLVADRVGADNWLREISGRLFSDRDPVAQAAPASVAEDSAAMAKSDALAELPKPGPAEAERPESDTRSRFDLIYRLGVPYRNN